MILARHADALFWVGRYLERTEATVRCLDYAANSIIHLRSDEARIEVEQLVKTLGLESVAAPLGSLGGRRQLFAFLLSDTANPGSVLSAVSAVRERLRSTRERIPIELWEEANGLYLRFREFGDIELPPDRLHETLLMVRRACLAISGVLNEGMRRDEGYEFIVLGRMIERSIFTVGLQIASYTDPPGHCGRHQNPASDQFSAGIPSPVWTRARSRGRGALPAGRDRPAAFAAVVPPASRGVPDGHRRDRRCAQPVASASRSAARPPRTRRDRGGDGAEAAAGTVGTPVGLGRVGERDRGRGCAAARLPDGQLSVPAPRRIIPRRA